MKKIILPAALLASVLTAQAQDTYLNNEIINNSSDVIGTSRFVGMGGAMGALGADLSTMGWNPAGIGMMRKSDIAFTAGAIWNQKGINEATNASASLDQIGAVYAIDLGGDSPLQFINIGFGYQKKVNFNHAYYADNNNLHGLSQMDQLAELATSFPSDYNLSNLAASQNFLSQDDQGYFNEYNGQVNRYTRRTSGSLNAFDFNISGNVNDRVYWGATFGFDNIRYRGWSDYFEESTNPNNGLWGDYSLYNDYCIDGWGFNMKFGTTFRPIEDSPLRFAIAVETPTWYNLKSSTMFQLTDHVDNSSTPMPESYLEYAIRSPWKLRLGVGSTVGNKFAWDVDYEFANYSATKMGYPNNAMDDPHNSIFSNTWDESMNLNTKNNLQSVHTLRAGLEFKPTSQLALRVGYNFTSSAYKDNVSFDQYSIDSYAMDYATTTNYSRLGATNILTLGLGYRWKYCYLDVAYKYRNQKADFYAFDTTFAKAGNQFADDNPSLANAKLDPVDVNLSRHQLAFTFGFKF